MSISEKVLHKLWHSLWLFCSLYYGFIPNESQHQYFGLFLPPVLRANYPLELSLCALLLSLPFSSRKPFLCLCTCLHEVQWSQSRKTSDMHVFPVKWPAIFLGTLSLAKALACVGEPATLRPPSAVAAKGVAAGNTSFFEVYS